MESEELATLRNAVIRLARIVDNLAENIRLDCINLDPHPTHVELSLAAEGASNEVKALIESMVRP